MRARPTGGDRITVTFTVHPVPDTRRWTRIWRRVRRPRTPDLMADTVTAVERMLLRHGYRPNRVDSEDRLSWEMDRAPAGTFLRW